jgi:hypothetical protein
MVLDGACAAATHGSTALPFHAALRSAAISSRDLIQSTVHLVFVVGAPAAALSHTGDTAAWL